MSAPAEGCGVLLVNLGTPSAPTATAVRSFLREFLSDPRVVEIPRIVWLPILYGFILTARPAKSAAKYCEIWTAEGSPLAVHTARQAALLAAHFAPAPGKPGIAVEVGMRYGEPSIATALQSLRDAGCARIVVLPLYPQYAASTTASVRDALGMATGSGAALRQIAFVEQFHDDPGYIDALAETIARHWAAKGSLASRGARLVMSFHGIPQRAVERGDPYEQQCLATARLLAERLELKRGDWLATFQSRFGRAEWLQPYTEPTLLELARQGLAEVDVVCPGFVSDCLETLEEIGIGARAAFLAAGGREFQLIPCLNESPGWIAALAEIALGRTPHSAPVARRA